MQDTWTITTLENGRPAGTYIASRESAFRALDWKLRGGSIEDRIRTEQPVETEAQSSERSAEVRVAA